MNYIVDIENLDHQGRGIGRLNGKIVFIEQALVGEKVKIKVTLEKSKFYEGKIIEIIEKSPNRIESKCPYFKECGGCDLLHMPYEKQLEFKQNKVKNILTKYADIQKIDEILKPIIKSNDIFNYRNKVIFQVQENIGFYKRKSYELIAVENCLLITKNMNEILKLVKQNLSLSNVDKLLIKDMGNCQVMLTIYLHKLINLDEFLEKMQNKIASINIFIKNKPYKTIGGSNIIVKLLNCDFLVSPTSFFQINLGQTVKLYEIIAEYCDLKQSDQVLDLYCGTGTIGIYLSKYCKNVLGIEINEEAIEDAKKNKDMNNIKNISFIAGDTKEVIKKINFHPNVIVVDPPRAGLDNSVINDILKINAERLIYVSCDPITLARDLSILKNNYNVIEITPVDMFPNTYHVECVCVLNRH